MSRISYPASRDVGARVVMVTALPSECFKATMLATKKSWARYTDALKSWKVTPETGLDHRVFYFRSLTSLVFAVYAFYFVLPRSGMPPGQVLGVYLYVCFAAIVALVNFSRKSAVWHVANMLHWMVFALFLMANIAYSALFAQDLLRAIFWGVWLPYLYIDAAIVFGSVRSVFLLIGVWGGFLVTSIGYFIWISPLNPGRPTDDLIVAMVVAHENLINLIFLLILFREHYAESLAKTEALVVTANEAMERRRVESELISTQLRLESIRRKLTLSALAASIAHEINQPLAAIVTNASAALRWLSSENENTNEARETLKRISEDGLRAGAVIASVRALLRKGEPQHEPIDINNVVLETIKTLKDEFLQRGVAVKVRLDDGLPRVQGSRVQLQQVFYNLALNGMEAMQEVPERDRILSITTRVDGNDMIEVQIEDYGCQIPEDAANKIFDVFFSTKAEGMGMGLVVCKSIVEAHGGDLAFLPGSKGTVFIVTFPIGEDRE